MHYERKNVYCLYQYVLFTNQNSFGGGTSASYAFHQLRVPQNFTNGLTHSFQYFADGSPNGASSPAGGGTAEKPGAHNYVYWELQLYAITSSTSGPAANIYGAPVFVTASHISQSWNGATGVSGSILTATSYFYDKNGYITPNSILLLNVLRRNEDNMQSPYPGGGGAGSNIATGDYTGSVNLISFRYNWNTT